MLSLLPIGICLSWLSPVAAQGASSRFIPARPPSIPLAVKSPYLSTWQSAGTTFGNGGYLAGQWPSHWSAQTTGWAGLIRVDGNLYQWMGVPAGSISNQSSIPNVLQTQLEYTSTKSIFTMNVGGKVQLNITFLSPVNVDDLRRQSLPFSYMQTTVASLDGNAHSTQLYTDVTGEFATGEPDAIVRWSFSNSSGVAYHKFGRQVQIEFDENDKPYGNGLANWGDVFYATDVTEGLTVQSGSDSTVRTAFAATGKLDGTADTNFRAVTKDYPTFAFAVDFGDLSAQPKRALFTLGLTQRNAIQFLGYGGVSKLPALWTTYFSSDVDALLFAHKDYSYQFDVNTQLDNKVNSDSVAVGGASYAKLTTLAVRQSWGATQLVERSPGKPYLFMKEISSNGNTQTIDVVFPLHPIVIYQNASLLRLMLDPMYENQESGNYPNKYSIHDLGTHYPNATGHPDGKDEEMPVEECGNMLIMTLSYTQHTNDVDYLKSHYPILNQWTQFLINDSLVPALQLSTDDFAGRLENQTNLALKGIIGIRAMGEIARLVGNSDDSARYNQIAYDYIGKWADLGIARDASPPHTTLRYGFNETHGLLYNIWADLSLGLNLVPQYVYDQQSNFYPTVKQRYGIPLDTRHGWTKTDWEIFAAAAASVETRNIFLDLIAAWIDETVTGVPLTDLYETDNGQWTDARFRARPVMGGTFALLVANPQQANGGKCEQCVVRPADVRRLYAPDQL